MDGADSTVEAVVDAEGRANLEVDPSTGPWDVTFALADHIPISILGLTASVSAPVTLLSYEYEPAPTAAFVEGAITGRAAETSDLEIWGSVVKSYSLFEDSFQVGVAAPPPESPLRLLFVEWNGNEPPRQLLNAAWLELEWTGEDLQGDVVLPMPPRSTVQKTLFIEPPRTGKASAESLELPVHDYARRLVDGSRLPVGTVSVVLDPDVDGRLHWQVDALDGDMAPDRINVSVPGEDGRSIVVSTSTIEDGRSIAVEEADLLKAAGSTLGTLSLSWSAPDHDFVGASVHRDDGKRGSWFVYSYGPFAATERSLPKLPTQVALEDVHFDGDPELFGYVFALAHADDGKPWDWRSGVSEQRAVAQAFGTIPPDPTSTDAAGGMGGAGGAAPEGGADAGNGGAGGESGGGTDEPALPAEGIYSLVDVLMNSSNCEAGGESTLAEEAQSLFYVLRKLDTLSVASCSTTEACREQAAYERDNNGNYNSDWTYVLQVPSSSLSGGQTVYLTQATDDGLCRDVIIERATLVDALSPNLTFDVFILDVPEYPADAGECTAGGAVEAASTSPVDCHRRKRVFGVFTAPLQLARTSASWLEPPPFTPAWREGRHSPVSDARRSGRSPQVRSVRGRRPALEGNTTSL